MSAWGKPPNTEAFSTAPLASAAIAMSMMSFMGWRDGVCTSVLVIIGREPQTMTGAISPASARRSVRAGALGRRAHVDVGIGAVAGDDGGVVDHARGHVRVEVEAHRDRQGRRHRANPAQELALAVVHVLAHHRAVQREERRVAAVPDGAHDGVAHVLVRGLLDIARRVRAARDGDDDLGAHLVRHVQEAAELGIGVAELLDGRGAGERPERGERRPHRREGIGLVHHHRDDDLLASHRRSPSGCGRVMMVGRA